MRLCVPTSIEWLRRCASAAADIVVTTEKDLVRLLMHRPWPFRVAVVPLSVGVEPAGEFASWLAARLSLVRARERPTA